MDSSRQVIGTLCFLIASTVPTLGDTGPSEASEGDPSGMVAIPGGSFTMGRTFETSDDSSGMRPLILRDDRPAREVHVSAFWMDAKEVTHEDYAAFVTATSRVPPYHWLDGRMPADLASHPIYNVDWDDATSYCSWIGKRLPTEAEWERAARGALEGEPYPWGSEKPTPEMARYSTQFGPGPVGSFLANDFGLHDMAGNITEWCQDWFSRTYYADGPDEDPRGPAEGAYRIVRGGAWSDGPNRITVFFRNWLRPNQKTPNLGFRCVRARP